MNTAIINVTYDGISVDLPDPVSYLMTDEDIISVARETLSQDFPGWTAPEEVDMSGYVVDRYPATENHTAFVILRPKTGFGL